MPPDFSAAAVARLIALPCLMLELLVHVAGVAAAEDGHVTGGHGKVQALLLAHLGLQGRGQQEHVTRSPESSLLAILVVDVKACLPPCLPHPGEGLKRLPKLTIVGVCHGFGGRQDHLVGLELLAIFQC